MRRSLARCLMIRLNPQPHQRTVRGRRHHAPAGRSFPLVGCGQLTPRNYCGTRWKRRDRPTNVEIDRAARAKAGLGFLERSIFSFYKECGVHALFLLIDEIYRALAVEPMISVTRNPVFTPACECVYLLGPAREIVVDVIKCTVCAFASVCRRRRR